MNNIDNIFSFFYFNENKLILLPNFIKIFSNTYKNFYDQNPKISMIGEYEQKICLDYNINHIVYNDTLSSLEMALNMDSSLIIFNKINSFNDDLKRKILQSVYSTNVCLFVNCNYDFSFLSKSQRKIYDLNNLTIQNKIKQF